MMLEFSLTWWFISDQLGPDRNPVCTCFTIDYGERRHETDRNYR